MKERVIQVDHDLHKLSVCKSVCFLYWHFPSHCYVIGGFNLLRIALLSLTSVTQFISVKYLRRTAERKLVRATQNAKVAQNNKAKGLGNIRAFYRQY